MKGGLGGPCARRTTVKGGRVLAGGYGRYRVLRSCVIRADTGVIGGIGLKGTYAGLALSIPAWCSG